MLRRSKVILGLLFILVCFGASAQADTLTFEGLPDLTVLTSQISGVTFTNAIVLTAGMSLNEFDFPPHSGTNVISDDGGPVTLVFSSPVNAFSGYFTHNSTVTLAAYDASNNLLGSVASPLAENWGNLGNLPNEILTLNFAGISRVVMSGDTLGASFVADDLSFTTSTSIPEPATLPVVMSGYGLYVLLRRRFKIAQ